MEILENHKKNHCKCFFCFCARCKQQQQKKIKYCFNPFTEMCSVDRVSWKLIIWRKVLRIYGWVFKFGFILFKKTWIIRLRLMLSCNCLELLVFEIKFDGKIAVKNQIDFFLCCEHYKVSIGYQSFTLLCLVTFLSHLTFIFIFVTKRVV